MRRYFNRWTEMSEVDQSYAGLADLMLREQFLLTCFKDLALFLKERVPRSMDEMMRLAEQYIEAHGGNITSGRSNESRQRPSVGAGQSQTPKIDKGSINKAPTKTVTTKRTCFLCGEEGHFARDCKAENKGSSAGIGRSKENRDRKVAALSMSVSVQENIEDGHLKLANGESLPMISSVCTVETLEGERNILLKPGFVGDKPVKVLRDTGCELAAVRRELVSDDQYLGKHYVMITIDGAAKIVPAARVYVDTPYYEGFLEAMVPETLICDLVLGNLKCVRDTPDEAWIPRGHADGQHVAAAVMTRAMVQKASKPLKPLNVAVPSDGRSTELSPEELKHGQKKDPSLNKLMQHADEKRMFTTKGGNSYWFEVQDGILYRVFEPKAGTRSVPGKQIAVPSGQRRRVMELAHESIVGGHLSARKTEDRIITSFYWPGISSDVSRFCKSCDVCQKTIPKGRVSKVPLGEMPIIDTPFHRVAVDLVGPITPVSDRGNRYILTVVDYATRYPEAVALPHIETERVAEALIDVFSRVGFPNEVLSDRGTQFTSGLMKEVSRLVSIRQLFTTPYNPKCNGFCERINGVLKSMLKKMCQEKPKDWDRYLSAVLFAYREVPQASTGFSPFELLYGRTVRGPVQALKELWSGEEAQETRNTYEYVLDLRHRLEETCKIARDSLRESQQKYKHHYDKGTRRRSLAVGDKVLVLLPTDNNKLLLQWKGPFEVIDVLNRMDYRVQVGDKQNVFHINLLKKYEERDADVISASVAIVEAESCPSNGVVDDENLLDLPSTGIVGETYLDVDVNHKLTEKQKYQVMDLLQEYREIFTERPGCTRLDEHVIEVTSSEPIRVKQYPMPYAKRTDVESEVSKMLDMGVIECARADYNSPVVLVRKKDNTNRFCVDFRRLNAITKFDTEPMGNVEDTMARLKNDAFFSKIDLSKGYWQIEVAEDSRPMTAFTTESGSYQFRRMPFGLINAGATFNRMMRKLLHCCSNTDHYVDDILGHTMTWSQHMDMLRELFRRIKDAGLTVKPSKCSIGYDRMGFTGHVVGHGRIGMEDDKLGRIRDAPVPETKKQVRSFLGLAGYYRKFIPSFAEIASPLTDLTKKGKPNKLVWESEHQQAFQALKDMLTSAPILRMPDFDKPFLLQTDASDSGVGAALLQEHDDGCFPVAYASKKLLKREQNYSVMERECLALVFGVKHFQKYLYGNEFVIQTDHAPLSYIQRCKLENGRIMRWALFLQNYSFRIEAIKGSANVVADYLSRQ
jgi:hypothetical protein